VSDSFEVERTEPLLHSRVFSVERRTIEHDGETFTRDVAVHTGAVAILAIDDEGRVGLVHQYRSTFDRYLWEIPAGTRDVVNEEPLDTAKRELLEELGCEAGEWTLLGRFMNSPGWTTQVMTIYEARSITHHERAPAGPEEASSTVRWVPLDELRQLLWSEDAIDSTTAVALHRVLGTFFER
jgi:8-oxo-dGDP phosphatase